MAPLRAGDACVSRLVIASILSPRRQPCVEPPAEGLDRTGDQPIGWTTVAGLAILAAIAPDSEAKRRPSRDDAPAHAEGLERATIGALAVAALLRPRVRRALSA
jgi:hypothetical protein